MPAYKETAVPDIVPIPYVNVVDGLRIPSLSIDPAKNLQPVIKKAHSNNAHLYPSEWKFNDKCQDNGDSTIERNKEFFELFKVDQYGQPPLINGNEKIKNPVLGDPTQKDNRVRPDLQQLNSYTLLIPDADCMGLKQGRAAIDAGALFNTDKISGADISSKYAAPGNWGSALPYGDTDNNPGISIGDNANTDDETEGDNQADDLSALRYNSERTVNINLNTPLIGNFTINTNDAGSGIGDLRTNVEDALLEILNSANAIQ